MQAPLALVGPLHNNAHLRTKILASRVILWIALGISHVQVDIWCSLSQMFFSVFTIEFVAKIPHFLPYIVVVTLQTQLV